MNGITQSIQDKTNALLADLKPDSKLLAAYRAMSPEELTKALIERGFTVDELNVIQESEYEGFDQLLERVERGRVWWFA